MLAARVKFVKGPDESLKLVYGDADPSTSVGEESDCEVRVSAGYVCISFANS